MWIALKARSTAQQIAFSPTITRTKWLRVIPSVREVDLGPFAEVITAVVVWISVLQDNQHRGVDPIWWSRVGLRGCTPLVRGLRECLTAAGAAGVQRKGMGAVCGRATEEWW